MTWGHKFDNLTGMTDLTIETNLPLENGDIGEPIFNEKGEVLGLNLKTAALDSIQQDIQSVSANSRVILEYLDSKLGKIDFEERWGFHYYPSFWRKNRGWLLTAGAAAGGGLIAVLIKAGGEIPPPEPLTGHPEFP